MAAIGNTALTYTDWAKRYNDGRISVIVELLSQTNEILDDMRWVEGNLPTGHRTSVRTGLPQGTWRQLNYGVQPTKSTTTQITDACGMLETYSEIDKALADLNGNSAEFRLAGQPCLERCRSEGVPGRRHGSAARGGAPWHRALSAPVLHRRHWPAHGGQVHVGPCAAATGARRLPHHPED